MSAAPVSRVSVVVEYADGQVTRMSCDRPAHAELEVNYSPAGGFPYSARSVYPAAGASIPELRLEVRAGYAPVSVETVQGAAIATLDAGCVMLALPGETTTPGPFGETTLEFTVPVAPAA